MAVSQYIGARYVQVFADPAEWSSAKEYEPLTVVLHEGNSFTSKQFVPVGIDINNETYWAETGNFNAQVEQYRRETLQALDAATIAQNDIDTLLPKSSFSSENTVYKAISDINDSITSIDNEVAFNKNAAFQASNLIEANPLAVLSLLDDYEGISFTGMTPQALIMKGNNTAVIFIAQLTTDELMGVDIIEIDLNSSIISNRFLNNQLKHCNGACYNPNTGFIYVADTYIHKLDPITYENIETLPIEATSISYDKVTGKMYALQSMKCYEFDPTTDKISDDFLFSIDTSLAANGYKYNGVPTATQNLFSYNGTFYFGIAGLSRISAYIIYNNKYEFERIMPIDNFTYLYDIEELQGGDFNERGDLFFACRATVGSLGEYALICGINTSSKMNYMQEIKYRNTDTVYVGESTRNTNDVSILGVSAIHPFRTFAEALLVASRYQIPKIMNSSGLVKMNPSMTAITTPFAIEINGVLELTHQVEVFAPCVIRGNGVIRGDDKLLRFWNSATLSGITFDISNQANNYVFNNFCFCSLNGVRIASDGASIVSCGRRGITSMYNCPDITLNLPGTIAS